MLKSTYTLLFALVAVLAIGLVSCGEPLQSQPSEQNSGGISVNPYTLDELIRGYNFRVKNDKGFKGRRIRQKVAMPDFVKSANAAQKGFKRATKRYPAGASLYATNCASCHGNMGQGMVYKSIGVAPLVPLWTRPLGKLKGFGSVQAMRKALEEGNKGLVKSDFAHLSNEQAKALLDFIQAVR